MDEHNLDTFILKAKQLEAENELLRQSVRQYETASQQTKASLVSLEERAAAGAAAKSYLDLQTEELAIVRGYIRELMQQAEAAAQREADLEKQLSLSVSTYHQLEDIRSRYNHLQVQLNDITERLQQMNMEYSRQLLLTSRIAELESELANAAEEIELLKNPPPADT